jgi:hypothetical protein
VTAPESAAFLVVAFNTLAHLSARVDDVTLDDTTVRAVEERPVQEVAARWPRKVVSYLGRIEAAASNRALYDPLGRKVCGREQRPGVYFILEER